MSAGSSAQRMEGTAPSVPRADTPSDRRDFKDTITPGVVRQEATARFPQLPGSAFRTIAARVLAVTMVWVALDTGRAEEPAGRNVRVELRVVAVPLPQALRLVPALRKPATFADAEARVLALVAGGEAELVEQLQGAGLSGTKFTAESIREIRYRSEVDLFGDSVFDRLHSPYAWDILRRKATPPLAVRQEQARRRQQRWEESFQEMLNRGFSFNPTTPTAIDTRNTGVTLEAEPQVDPARRRIELSVAVQSVSFDGLESRLLGSVGAPAFDPPQARFSTCKFQTVLTLDSGQGTLLGTHVQQQPRPRMLLFLLHATAPPSPYHP